MEFESPDVEKEFPGLFVSGTEFEDRDGGRRRRERKDRGYAALSGDSSPEKEHPETKSPIRCKRKAFKFAGRKEKRDKSRPQPPPVFGVDLDTAVRRLPCLDGVALPLPLRHCLDCLREHSGTRVSPTPAHKITVVELRAQYDARCLETPVMCPPVAWELLRLFLASLPQPLLPSNITAQLLGTGASQITVVNSLPEIQRTVLAWLVRHMDAFEARHCSIAVLNAAARLPPRLLFRLRDQVDELFDWCQPVIHVEPLTGTATPPLPEHPMVLAAEIGRQERLLALIHRDMGEGFTCEAREEQLWCVQRIVTHLKRRLRLARLQWNTEVDLLLPHSGHPNANDVIRLQIEYRLLRATAVKLQHRLANATTDLVLMQNGTSPPVTDENWEPIVADNASLLTKARILAENIHNIYMDLLQLQVNATIEQESLLTPSE
ncbi:ralA-binding protein 1 [Phlebotomus argentipes]|uniref:ralA-binding protein 1 n=1 Tax=Phlebotomus argentipes TaxID=94469 RepID=UPI002892FD4B|nr:ralA-binding protein 1 [Phlebotomus argentipes]